MLRYDDSGLSLYDLLIEMRDVYQDDPRHLVKICSTLKNTSESRSLSMKFESDYTNSRMKIF